MIIIISWLWIFFIIDYFFTTSISVIFKTRTCSPIFKHDFEMRVKWNNGDFIAIEKSCIVGYWRTLWHFSATTMLLNIFEIYKSVLTEQRVWLSPTMLPTIVTRSLVLCVCFANRCLFFFHFSFVHCVVCHSSIYGFWLHIGIFKLFLEQTRQTHSPDACAIRIYLLINIDFSTIEETAYKLNIHNVYN